VEDVGAGRAVGNPDEERLSSSQRAAIRSIVVSGQSHSASSRLALTTWATPLPCSTACLPRAGSPSGAADVGVVADQHRTAGAQTLDGGVDVLPGGVQAATEPKCSMAVSVGTRAVSASAHCQSAVPSR
jgi:hypothetical protein